MNLVDKEKKLVELFYSTKTQAEVIKEVATTYKTLTRVWRANFTDEELHTRKVQNYRKSRLGELNPAYGKPCTNRKDFVSDGKGYQIEIRPDWFVGRKGSNHIFKHHLVMCEALGLTELPKGFVVHHIDGNKLNNKLNNLALLTVSAHGRLHCRERKILKDK